MRVCAHFRLFAFKRKSLLFNSFVQISYMDFILFMRCCWEYQQLFLLREGTGANMCSKSFLLWHVRDVERFLECWFLRWREQIHESDDSYVRLLHPSRINRHTAYFSSGLLYHANIFRHRIFWTPLKNAPFALAASYVTLESSSTAGESVMSL